MKKITTILVLLITLSTIGYAQEYSCSDGSTSTFSTTIIVDSNSIPIEYNETCSFGCRSESGRCNPSPYDISMVDVGVMFAILLVGITFFYVSFKTDQEAYKLMYFLVGLMFVFATVMLAIILIQTSNKSITLGAVESLIWFFELIIGFTTLLLFIMIIKDATDYIRKKKLFIS